MTTGPLDTTPPHAISIPHVVPSPSPQRPAFPPSINFPIHKHTNPRNHQSQPIRRSPSPLQPPPRNRITRPTTTLHPGRSHHSNLLRRRPTHRPTRSRRLRRTIIRRSRSLPQGRPRQRARPQRRQRADFRATAGCDRGAGCPQAFRRWASEWNWKRRASAFVVADYNAGCDADGKSYWCCGGHNVWPTHGRPHRAV